MTAPVDSGEGQDTEIPKLKKVRRPQGCVADHRATLANCNLHRSVKAANVVASYDASGENPDPSYNEERQHQSLGYRTPQQAYAEQWSLSAANHHRGPPA